MSKKIILRQSVKSGVAVVFFFGLGMASINAQTTQTTQPTGKVGINTTNPTETLDVKGKVRIQELYTDNQQTGTNNATFTATNVVTVDNNGVLGKKTLSSIIMPTIPTEPWRQLGGTNEATTNTQNIYQNGKVGIGNYASTSNFDSDFEVNSNRNGYHIGIANGADIKWNLSAENDGEKSFTLTRRHKDLSQGRLLSITKDAKLYLGNTLTTPGGGNTKITLDGKDGNIILIDKWRVGLKGNSLMFYNSSTTGDSNNKFTLTKEGKLFLGKDLNGDGNGTGANILLNGDNGRVAIGKNSAEYNLDVEGDAKISGLKTTSDNITNGSTTSKYSPAKMVVVDENGVLGKQDFPTIPTMPTIPTEPWRQLGGTNEATTNTQNIYQNGKVGIGNYASTSNFDSDFEVNSNRNGYHIGIANGADIKWNLSAENDGEKSFTLTRRHKDLSQGRLLSITKDAKLYLGNTLTTPGGGNTKITLDGKDGNIILIDKWRVGLKGNSLMFYNSSTTGDSNNKFTLTKEGKLFLGKDLNGDGNGTGANILLDGKEGKVAIGKNSANYTLDVNGNTGIKGRLNLIDADSDNTDFLLYSKGTQLLFDKKITVPTIGTSATQTGVTAALTNVGKLYLGSGLTSSSNNIYSENAKILLDGQDGKVAIGHNSPAEALDVKGKAKIQTIDKQTTTTDLDMVVVGADGVLKKAAIPTSGGSGNGVKNHTGSNDAVQCNATNAGTIHYKEGVTVNGNTKSTSVMGFCMKTANGKYRWFYIFGGAGTTAGSEAEAPNFGEGIQ